LPARTLHVEGCADASRPTDQGAFLLEASTVVFIVVEAAMAVALGLLARIALARSDIKDYEFQLVNTSINTDDAILSVRLIHNRTSNLENNHAELGAVSPRFELSLVAENLFRPQRGLFKWRTTQAT
jgi:hypothetical protein